MIMYLRPRWALSLFLLSTAIPAYGTEAQPALAPSQLPASLQAAATVAPTGLPSSHTQAFTSLGLFLAGFPQEGALQDLEQQAAWQAYRTNFDQQWAEIDKARRQPMTAWRDRALGDVDLPVFYPMGGPDIFNMLVFFPYSPEYIMVGLERIGSLITLESLKTERRLHRMVGNIQQSLSSLFQRSFFITKDMSKDFYEQGVLPTLIALIVRMGGDILDVQYVAYNPDSQIKTGLPLSACQGVEIVFQRKGQEKPQKIYYFRQNLDNQHSADFIKFIEARGKFAVMFKSSSYTPHQVGFSHLVSLVEKCAALVVQDDSGLPYARLLKMGPVQLYGHYTKPYGDVFYAYRQPDLAQAFKNAAAVQPLDFRIGYGYGKAPSCLEVMRVSEKIPQSAKIAPLAQNMD